MKSERGKMEKINELYSLRFNDRDRKVKNKLWKVICRDFFQKYIHKNNSVLDLGAGFCEFINNIDCADKYAVDINTDIRKFAAQDVKIFVTASTNMKSLKDESVDVVFASEFFEHLKNNEELFETFVEIYRILKVGGRLIILCPNIRYLRDRYWDFIDHRLPLNHVGLEEALLLYRYKVIKNIPKFLPYTTKSVLPKSAFLLRLYLKLPIVWKIFGKQMLIIAEK